MQHMDDVYLWDSPLRLGGNTLVWLQLLSVAIRTYAVLEEVKVLIALLCGGGRRARPAPGLAR